MLRTLVLALLTLALVGSDGLRPSLAKADDWPQWMGPNRDGVWSETGIVKTLPKGDPKQGNRLKSVWACPSPPGTPAPRWPTAECSSPTRLAKGVKNPDDPFDTKREVSGTERVHCLDATDGHELWKYEYHCPYQISYPAGPRCTPTVHDARCTRSARWATCSASSRHG